MTNFEKLYASTDSMADFIEKTVDCHACPMIECCINEGGTCRENMKKWLEMEVVDNE